MYVDLCPSFLPSSMIILLLENLILSQYTVIRRNITLRKLHGKSLLWYLHNTLYFQKVSTFRYHVVDEDNEILLNRVLFP